MSVVIVGSAASTSLGYTLEPSLAAMGANLSNFSTSTISGSMGEAITYAPFPTHEPDMPREERLTSLLGLAIEDLVTLLDSLKLADLPAMLGVAHDLDQKETSRLKQVLDIADAVRPLEDWAIPFGRASAFAAIKRAVDMLNANEASVVVVGAVDSLCTPSILRDLVKARRILEPGAEGSIPGEAAAFLVLARDDHPAATARTAFGLEGLALARTSTPFLETEIVDAEALTRLFSQFRESGCGAVHRVVAAHSGEGYFGRSFAHAYLRESELMPEPLDVELTAERIGDVGAASAVMGMAFAPYFMTDGGRILAYTESDTGEVGAAILGGRPVWRRQ